MGEPYADLKGLAKINDMRPRVMFPFERAKEKGGGDGGGNDALFRLLLWNSENIQWRSEPFAWLHFYGTTFNANICCLLLSLLS